MAQLSHYLKNLKNFGFINFYFKNKNINIYFYTTYFEFKVSELDTREF